MKVMVTGVKGQLGQDVVAHLNMQGIEAKGVDIDDFDLTNAVQTQEVIQACKPDAVIHCAAYTAVDRAEEQKELSYAVNVTGTKNIAEACKALGSKMIYISTDYVFGGSGTDLLMPDSPKLPQNQYGLTKLQGEEVVTKLLENYFIVRTSWVFGKGHNFVKTMLRLGAEKPSLNVVCDQIGSPTYTDDLASLLVEIAKSEKYGVYHATNEGFCSWSEFAQAIMEESGLECTIKPIPTSEYTTPAARPFNSRLSKDCLDKNGFNRLPHWRDALKRYLKTLC